MMKRKQIVTLLTEWNINKKQQKMKQKTEHTQKKSTRDVSNGTR